MSSASQQTTSHRLLQLGIALFLLGLLAGFAVPALANPRMGLATHIEGIMNGMFLLTLGLLWPRLVLSARLLATTFWLAIYGTFANWTATLLAAIWGAGVLMPIAAQGHSGTALQEMLVKILLGSLSIAMLLVCVLLLLGLRITGRHAAES